MKDVEEFSEQANHAEWVAGTKGDFGTYNKAPDLMFKEGRGENSMNAMKSMDGNKGETRATWFSRNTSKK